MTALASPKNRPRFKARSSASAASSHRARLTTGAVKAGRMKRFHQPEGDLMPETSPRISACLGPGREASRAARRMPESASPSARGHAASSGALRVSAYPGAEPSVSAHDSHQPRQDGRGRRGGRGMARRQPDVKREERRLDKQPHGHQGHGAPIGGGGQGCGGQQVGVEHAVRGINQHHPRQREDRAGEREGQVA